MVQSQDKEHQQIAKDLFSTLHEHAPEDRYATAGLVAASPETASSTITSLTPIDKLISSIDTSALEEAGIARPTSSVGVTLASRKRPAEDSKPKKAKKMRPSRMPKDFDPEKKPDPERWLPLRDRSSYRPKGKKGKAKANLLSQGAAPTADSDGSRPGTPGGEVIKAKPQAGGGGKKKGKGKR